MKAKLAARLIHSGPGLDSWHSNFEIFLRELHRHWGWLQSPVQKITTSLNNVKHLQGSRIGSEQINIVGLRYADYISLTADTRMSYRYFITFISVVWNLRWKYQIIKRKPWPISKEPKRSKSETGGTNLINRAQTLVVQKIKLKSKLKK
jgi:hypothetical protein